LTINIRYGAYRREAEIRQHYIDCNKLVALHLSEQKKATTAGLPDVEVHLIDVHRLVYPYISTRLSEQLKAVIPLSIYLVLFQLLIFRQNIQDMDVVLFGLIAVIIGLMLFMEGLKVGLMPFGQLLGTVLPGRSTLPVVLAITFLLGIGVTFAEPAIGALKAAGQSVQPDQAPYLFILLNLWAGRLVLVVGIGVGVAAVLGTIRFLYSWSLKPFIYATLIPVLLVTLWIQQIDALRTMVALAWDCGAVTTGPVTVPLVLSLGIGIASAAGKSTTSLSGFGIVTLASLFPILGVELLALYLYFTVAPAEIQTMAVAAANDTSAWFSQSPWLEAIGGLRAIVPLVIFLLAVMIFVCKERIRNPMFMTYGICLTVIGMIIFNLGLTYGLSNLGGQSGGIIPGAFMEIDAINQSPLYSLAIGLIIAVGFSWFLGFGATLAEPALNALGATVESLTNGSFRKSLLMYSVSTGVAFGIALGVIKIIYHLDIAYLLIPLYAVALVMTWFSTEEFVNVAWDSAGVTTGPVTVPLVLSMGMGFATASRVTEGFGILAMASVGPIIAVMGTGLWINYKISKKLRASNKAEIQASPA
jgi:hypothetical protein